MKIKINKREIEDIDTFKTSENKLLVENVKIEITENNESSVESSIGVSWNLEVFFKIFNCEFSIEATVYFDFMT